jgi:anti-sigma factor RsiW
VNCRHAMIQMLEAAPADLRGEGDAGLAQHLSECPRCRSVAERMLREHDLLAEALSVVRPRAPIDQALGRARLEAQRRKRRRIWLSSVPALAAAGLAALLLAWPSHEPSADGTPVAANDATPTPLVESSNADAVTIMHTDNPNIVVIWLTKSRSPS